MAFMPWVKNDGGRAAAGYHGSAGDCVTRALAIAMELDYQLVYDAMANGNLNARKTRGRKKKVGRKTAREGIFVRDKWFKDFMASHGWTWTPTMTIGSGCKVHLVADELPPGRIIVSLSRHYCAVIDGVINDTYDPNDRPPPEWLEEYGREVREPGPRCVYGYWKKAA